MTGHTPDETGGRDSLGRCTAEMCPLWTGDGCYCAVADGDLDDPRAQQFLDALDDMAGEAS